MRRPFLSLCLASCLVLMFSSAIAKSGRKPVTTASAHLPPAAIAALQKIDPEHIRAHAAEGVLFRHVLEVGSTGNDLPSSVHSERGFEAAAAARLTLSIEEMRTVLADIGRMLGTPWRADEKAAAMAAWIGLANQLTAKQ